MFDRQAVSTRCARRFVLEMLEDRRLLSTFVVESTKASGPGSLRQAIVRANAHQGLDTISFDLEGTISPGRFALPKITGPVTIDGTTAPNYNGTPVVTVDFGGTRGLTFARGADGSTLRGLALVRAGGAGVTLVASHVTIEENYIGLRAEGTRAGNRGDGVRVLAPSRGNTIGHTDPVSSIDYYDTSGISMTVSGWQGIRAASTPGQYMITGTSGSNGLLYIGPINGSGGSAYAVNYPGAVASSVYGPEQLDNGNIRLVGTYRTGNDSVLSFVFEGTTADLGNSADYRTIAYPNVPFTYVHSTDGGLAVGNYVKPEHTGDPVGIGHSFVYDLATGQFTDIVVPGAVSDTAYGIWHNGGTSYTICGGFTDVGVSNIATPDLPIGTAYLVDYDAATHAFSHWQSYSYPHGPASASVATHFQGISSVESGVYTLAADGLIVGSNTSLPGSWVTVRRNANGSFGDAVWVDLDDTNVSGSITSANSVYGNQVVGILLGAGASYQATVNSGFQLSNVISGNGGNGIGIYGSSDNHIAMNNIGTDAAGSTAFGNGAHGILITRGAKRNIVGGQATGGNSPTAGVIVRPPQGNLISGNRGDGVLINRGATNNLLSGNFVGTTASGNTALGNRRDGVVIDHANNNALIGCTFQQSPFVFYNVISGNRGNGLRINSSDHVTVHANFMGTGANNATIVANGGDGLLVEGTSRNTQVGGVIPLGNVISGNDRNGIEVRDKVSGFVSFNTFAGLYAFTTAAPNKHNGILITSTGGNNLIRTCIVSGNLGNGIVLGGHATGVQISEVAVGTDSAIQTAMPNGGDGILITGHAHGNAVGGFQPSVEPHVTVSANGRHGIEVNGQAHDNAIYHTIIGSDATGTSDLGNTLDGICIDRGTHRTTVGGRSARFRNRILFSGANGISVIGSTRNTVMHNELASNDGFGLEARGLCTGTVVTNNQIDDNDQGAVNLSHAKGVIYNG